MCLEVPMKLRLSLEQHEKEGVGVAFQLCEQSKGEATHNGQLFQPTIDGET